MGNFKSDIMRSNVYLKKSFLMRKTWRSCAIYFEKGVALMSWYEIAAVVGALAWVPQIISWIYNAVVKPSITFVVDHTAEVGFTTNGPIFNLTLAINAERKGVVLHGLQVILTHQSGEKHVFTWQGIVNRMGTMTAEGTRMPFEKDQNAIAIKISAGELEERFIRFQESEIVQKRNEHLSSAIDRMNRLKKESPNYHDALLKSDEVSTYIEMLKHSNFWKPGKYDCKIVAKSSTRYKVHADEFSFSLSVPDVEKLGENLELIDKEVENSIKAEKNEYAPHSVEWQWVNPVLVRPNKILKRDVG